MAPCSPPPHRHTATCPACGYPTVNAALCAVCSPLAAGLGLGPME